MATGSILDIARDAGLEPRRIGTNEFVVRCPRHANHHNGDAHPSCRLNPSKDTFYCDPCDWGGGLRDLADALGIEKVPRLARSRTRQRKKETPQRPSAQFLPSGPVDRLTAEAFGQRTGHHFKTETWNLLGWQLGAFQGKKAFGLPAGDSYKVVLPEEPEDGRLYANRMSGSHGLVVIDRDPASPIIVAEGPWDLMCLLEAGWPSAATCTGGAGTWRLDWNDQFKGRRVLVAYDTDPAGNQGAAKVAQSLLEAGIEHANVKLPVSGDPETDGKDWADLLRPAEDPLATIQALVASAEWVIPRKPAPGPLIRVTTDIAELVDKSEEALKQDGEVGFYQRGGMLVRLISTPLVPQDKGTHRCSTPGVAPVTEAHLLEVLSHRSKWVRQDKRVLPPTPVVKALLARGEWPFPVLTEVVSTPTMRVDGTLVSSPGHDPSTGIFYSPGRVRFPDIPAAPSREDALRALQLLREPFSDFPFTSDADMSVVLSGILSLVARPAIEGPTPGIAITSHTPGSGKSLIADVISIIGTGKEAARLVAPKDRDGDEWRKRILAQAIEGSRAILIDNLDQGSVVNSSTLSAALTAQEWSDRYLGQTRMVTVPLTPVWMLTGNNVNFSRDMARRVLPANLDPICEHPEDRSDFRHENLRSYVRETRPALVVAALTILRAYHSAGRPAHGLPAKGSFEKWDALVRGALIWIGVDDPVITNHRLRDQDDTDHQALSRLLKVWHDVFGSTPRTASSVLDRASLNPGHDDLRAALADFLGCSSADLDTRALGARLRSYQGRVAGNLRFERAPKKTGGFTHWRVVRVEVAAAPAAQGAR